MTVERALALPDPEDAIDALADPLWQRVNSDGDWSGLSATEQAIFGVWCLKVEVVNGGLSQFFFNGVGEATPEIVRGLRTIGAEEVAEILESATAIVGTDVQLSDWQSRQDRVKSLPPFEREQLSALDDKFYDLLPDTMQRARAFAEAHHGEFRDATIPRSPKNSA
jgi:hypothetical protein